MASAPRENDSPKQFQFVQLLGLPQERSHADHQAERGARVLADAAGVRPRVRSVAQEHVCTAVRELRGSGGSTSIEPDWSVPRKPKIVPWGARSAYLRSAEDGGLR